MQKTQIGFLGQGVRLLLESRTFGTTNAKKKEKRKTESGWLNSKSLVG